MTSPFYSAPVSSCIDFTPLYGFLGLENSTSTVEGGWGGLALFTLFLCLPLKIEKELTIRNVSKGGKPDRKPCHPFGFRMPLLNKKSTLFINSIVQNGKTEGRGLKFAKSQGFASRPQRNCTFINSISGQDFTSQYFNWYSFYSCSIKLTSSKKKILL